MISRPHIECDVKKFARLLNKRCELRSLMKKLPSIAYRLSLMIIVWMGAVGEIFCQLELRTSEDSVDTLNVVSKSWTVL